MFGMKSAMSSFALRSAFWAFHGGVLTRGVGLELAEHDSLRFAGTSKGTGG